MFTSHNNYLPAQQPFINSARSYQCCADFLMSEPNVATSNGTTSDTISPISAELDIADAAVTIHSIFDSEPNVVTSNRMTSNTISMELNIANTGIKITIHGNSELEARHGSNLLDDNDKVGEADMDQLVKADQAHRMKRENAEDEYETVSKKPKTM